MKIAIYQPRASYYVGGAEVFALMQAKWFSKLGHSVTLVTVRAPFIKQSEYFRSLIRKNKKIKVVFLKVPNSLRWLYKIPAGINWTRWNLESLSLADISIPYFLKQKFDVVGVHNVLDVFAIPKNQKIVLHLHGYPKKITKLLEKALSYPNKIVAVSKFVRKKWQSLTKLPPCEIAENAVESDVFFPMPIKKKFDILFVGRLIPIKGVRYLISASAKITKKIKNLRVAIAGRGELYKSLQKEVQRRKLSKNVFFLGYVKQAKLPALYNLAKIFAAPSYDREGILSTILEANACSVPVVAAKACSTPEFIKNGKNGLLVPPKDSESLAKTIIKLLTNETYRQRMGKQARKFIVKNWDWSKRIKKLELIYEQTATHN
jgi:glycosyltransferase involved in cell wall biosynthesis